MMQCNRCGQVNAQESNFCRFCGNNFSQARNTNVIPQTSNGNYSNGFEYSPPRPYVWKTDEFQIEEKDRRPTQQIDRVQPLNDFNGVTNQTARQVQYAQPLAQYQNQNVSYGYRCPRCATQLLPKISRKISTVGWIVFTVLMVTFFPLFWIGLLIKEDKRVCPVCNLSIN